MHAGLGLSGSADMSPPSSATDSDFEHIEWHAYSGGIDQRPDAPEVHEGPEDRRVATPAVLPAVSEAARADVPSMRNQGMLEAEERELRRAIHQLHTFPETGQPTSSQLDPRERPIRIYAGRIFDSPEATFLPHRVLTVSEASGLIIDVQSYNPDEIEHNATALFANSKAIDLRAHTLLPGFVDAHVHFFLRPYAETSWEDQLTKESLAERTVRATVHARRTLLAGFTTVRDLGTEGAADADIALRKALSGPAALVPGPRYFCANRAIVSTGSYGPKSAVLVNKEGIDGITGAEAADGIAGCVRAVRRQVGAGADWIKIYADYRVRSRVAPASIAASRAAIPTFSLEEVKAMVDTAHRAGVKVAVHTTNDETVHALTRGPELRGSRPDSIEHGTAFQQPDDHRHTDSSAPGPGVDPQQHPITWVPTLAAHYTLGSEPGGAWERSARAFRSALHAGADDLACGGDTGVFAHGDNALELRLMAALGAAPARVLRWATLGGWRCVRSRAWEGDAGRARLARVGELREDARVVGDNEVPFGVLGAGFAADIIATRGDLEGNFAAAVHRDSICFVMKGGRIYKRNGVEVPVT
ncbi:hypothetical protein BC834DRAFT_928010 [Gloeopeniophorella convolvens]|nr:hypothetical protein BC834DRAFT_928010 [Gloeopeniophorella convolvens]